MKKRINIYHMGVVYYAPRRVFKEWLIEQIGSNPILYHKFAYVIPDEWGCHKRKMRSDFFPSLCYYEDAIDFLINIMYEDKEFIKAKELIDRYKSPKK